MKADQRHQFGGRRCMRKIKESHSLELYGIGDATILPPIRTSDSPVQVAPHPIDADAVVFPRPLSSSKKDASDLCLLPPAPPPPPPPPPPPADAEDDDAPEPAPPPPPPPL